jgi:hypothetical protein
MSFTCHDITFSVESMYAVTSFYFIVYFIISVHCYIYYTSSVVNIQIMMHLSSRRYIVSYVYIFNSVFRIFKLCLKCVATTIGCPFLVKMDYKMRNRILSVLMLQWHMNSMKAES